MKIALITDTHFGIRNDQVSFLDYFDKFYKNVFFPYLEKNEIKTIFMLGDTFDRRKYVNFNTLSKAREIYFNKLAPYDVHMIVGNHDVHFKNTNAVNSPDLLLNDYNFKIYSSPVELDFDGCKIAALPWVCSGNFKSSMAFLDDTKAQILFGHLEIQGFEMHRGAVNDHGFEAPLFDKFAMVMSGHFHHKSSKGNIHYLGSPYEMTWNDFDDPRGFHIFDTDTRELEYIQNPYRMFNKVFYDDTNKDLDDLLNIDENLYQGSYVKVIVKKKNNPYWFDLFTTKLEKIVLDLQVVEDSFNLSMEDESDILDEAEDTLTILRKVVDSLDSNIDKKPLDNLLISLYTDALNLE